MRGDQQPCQALLATDADGIARVLATDNAQLHDDCTMLGCDAVAIGLVTDGQVLETGFYVWSGTAAVEPIGHPLDPIERDVVYRGTLRRAQVGELEALHALAPAMEDV